MGLFFNVRKPRKFNHQPIYYNPSKEALQERINKVKREMDIAPEDTYKPNIKGAFVDQTTHARKRVDLDEKDKSSKTIKLVIALIVLIVVFYYFYVR